MTQVLSYTLDPSFALNQDRSFLLIHPDMSGLQANLEAGKRLPNDLDQLKASIECFSIDKADQYDDILTVYQKIIQHSKEASSSLYPAIVKLAGTVVSYNLTVQDYYPALQTAAQEWKKASAQQKPEKEAEISSILQELSTATYVTEVEQVQEQLQTFFFQVKQDEQMLTPIASKYRNQFVDKIGLLGELKLEIDTYRQQLLLLSREYKLRGTIYNSYLWCPLLNMAIAVNLLATHPALKETFRKRIKNFLERLQKVKEEKPNIQASLKEVQEAEKLLKQLLIIPQPTEHDLQEVVQLLREAMTKLTGIQERQALLFLGLLDQAQIALQNIDDVQSSLFSLIEKLHAGWKQLDQTLLSFTQIKDKTAWIEYIIASIPAVVQQWKHVSSLADQYRANAFVSVIEEKDIETALDTLQKEHVG